MNYKYENEIEEDYYCNNIPGYYEFIYDIDTGFRKTDIELFWSVFPILAENSRYQSASVPPPAG